MMTPTTPGPRRKAVWGPKRTLIAAALVALTWSTAAPAAAKPNGKPGLPGSHLDTSKLDPVLNAKKKNGKATDTVDIIITLNPGQSLPSSFSRFSKRRFTIINAYELAKVPVSLLPLLDQDYSIHRATANHPTRSLDLLSNSAVQADILAQQYGYSGAGVGVAVIDSGFTSYSQPDLKDNRVKFVDFVDAFNNSRVDLNGHGTHVAGIIGGTGKIDPKEAGIAPSTSIVSLRVLDEQGRGKIGDIIAALQWVADNYISNNIRVVNMSVGAGVYESYWTDPLTLAVKALVDKGIVVVTAAGNFGKNANGQLQWGGITSPGVAPWVLTTCAFSTMGTLDQSDDVMADFSSSGPTAIDFTAKPDVCAPGVGVVSLAAPESQLYSYGQAQTPSWLLDPGNHPTYGYKPYLSLTGTSQATAVLSGTVALMLQANPNLTPNLVKAILQYTASFKPGVSPLRQGGGFVNALGAVQLAKFYAKAKAGAKLPIDPSWSRHIIWGNHRIGGGILAPGANAWMPGVEWGWAYTQGDDGDNIVWGTDSDGDNIVWGTDSDGDNIVWGTDDSDNIVWGTDDSDNIVWGTDSDGDNIVWGTDDSDNIVWGTDCGGGDCDNIVWGTDDGDNIVWGTAEEGDNIVWGTDDGDNIVWGTDDGDNIVWGTMSKGNVVWPFSMQGGN